MYKIYTRHRFRIPRMRFQRGQKKPKGIKSSKTEKMIKLIIVITIAILVVKTILDAVLPVFSSLCENKAKSIATIISNEQTTKVMKAYTYEKLFDIEKDQEGNINMIKSNIFTLNEITSDIAIRIQQELNNKGKDNIEIPLGSFIGFKLLSGQGPGIKLEISSIGNVETDVKSEFIEKGINQTLHQIYLQVKCKVSILTPFENIDTEITNQVLLAEGVIVGKIPSTYYNFKGTDQEKAGLEVIE